MTYLDMASRVLRGDGDGVFGANNSDFGQNSITNCPLNLHDLVDCFLVRQAVEEQVYIRSRAELFMIVLAQLAFSSVEFSRHGHQAVHD